MAKPNRLYLYGGIAVAVAAGYLLTDSPKPTKPARKAPTVGARPGSNKPLEGFDQRDLDAKFETVAVTTADAFKPLVIRDGAGGPGSTEAGMPNQVPSGFASGEAGWFFTGAAIIDQVPTALLENTQTGQGLYVKQGDLWKSCRIDRITPTSLTISAGDKVRTLMLLSDIPQQDTAGRSTQPLNPMSGPIGVQARPNAVPGNVPGQPNGRGGGGQGAAPNFAPGAPAPGGFAPAAPAGGPGGPGGGPGFGPDFGPPNIDSNNLNTSLSEAHT